MHLRAVQSTATSISYDDNNDPHHHRASSATLRRRHRQRPPQRSGETLRDLFRVIFNGNSATADSSAKHQRLFLVAVPPVRRKWGKKLLASLSAAGFTAKIVEMPNGERHKRLATLEKLAGQLSRLGADRNSVLAAFGGGVVGDVTGLLASLYMRGVDLIQIPTTVLAQVDASIGGKTAVNLRSGKNLLGTFHHPRVVLIDPRCSARCPLVNSAPASTKLSSAA